jgi:hypothetical protein
MRRLITVAIISLLIAPIAVAQSNDTQVAQQGQTVGSRRSIKACSSNLRIDRVAQGSAVLELERWKPLRRARSLAQVPQRCFSQDLQSTSHRLSTVVDSLPVRANGHGRYSVGNPNYGRFARTIAELSL